MSPLRKKKTCFQNCTKSYSTDTITCITSNPVYPYVAIGFQSGKLELVSVVDPKQMLTMAEFYLSDWPITKVAMSRSGNVMATANLAFGIFYIISEMKIITSIDYRRPIVDYAIDESPIYFHLIMLILKDEKVLGTNKIIEKLISKTEGIVKKRVFETPSQVPVVEAQEKPESGLLSEEHVALTYYSQKQDNYSQVSILRVGNITNKTNTVVYLKTVQSSSICRIELKTKRISMLNQWPTYHFLRFVKMYDANTHLLTWGQDGLVIIRSHDMQKIYAVFAPHHRKDLGITKVRIAATFKYAISLGRDGTVVCNNFVDIEPSPEYLRYVTSQFLELRESFSSSNVTIGFLPEDYNVRNYTELVQKGKNEEEEQVAKAIKIELYNRFQIVKKQVIKLLEANIFGPELEKIDLLEFFLHKKMREHKENMTDFECEWYRRWCKQTIEAQDKITSFLKKKYWDPMIIRRTKLRGIFANFEVENYVVFPGNEMAEYQYQKNLRWRRIEQMVRIHDALLCWLPTTDEQLYNHKKHEPIIFRRTESDRIRTVIEMGEDDDDQSSYLKFNIDCGLYYPSSKHLFIEPYEGLYDQAEVHSFAQIARQTQMLLFENVQIRKYFNNKFDELMTFKDREMVVIRERNERLRYILSELNLGNKINIEDPRWDPSEKPESYIKVEPNEVSVTPYISPSMQRILDEQAAEAERIRLALLADDFRERALYDMMHGVLEIRWEDTIKRDIPKPKCMLEKKVEDYTEEDLKTIIEYEKKVAFLMSERQRYKNMLEAEYTKLADSYRESVKKFNQRLRELLILKLKVDTALRQESLRLQHTQIYSQIRLKLDEKEQEAQKAIKNNEIEQTEIQKILQMLHDAGTECRTANESLLAKEKQLERLYKKDMARETQFLQSQAVKLYR